MEMAFCVLNTKPLQYSSGKMVISFLPSPVRTEYMQETIGLHSGFVLAQENFWVHTTFNSSLSRLGILKWG